MNFLENKKILIVAAHPDDEVLGMGGTMARALASGSEISVLFLGEGISARFPVEEYDSEEFRRQTKIRTEGAIRALEKLGVSKYHFGTRLCTQFESYSRLAMVKEIEQHILDYAPDVLFTHNPVEVNIDHKITYECVETACRPVRKQVPKEIYTFEIVCSGNWKFDESFRPNVYVDITKYLKFKLDAWHEYLGEDRPFPFPRSDKGLETLAQYRGMASGFELAEGFRLARRVI